MEMDTSMEDLFSDLEKSAHPTTDQDDRKTKTDSFYFTVVALDERLDVTVCRSDQYENALTYEIQLGDTGSDNPPIELIVAQNPAHAQSGAKWPIVFPCVLCNVLDRSAPSHDNKTVAVFTVPARLMLACWPNQAESLPKRIWLLGLANGWLYVLGRPASEGSHSRAVQCAPLCALPVSGSVVHWNLLEDPIMNASDTVLSGPRPISTVLFAFHASGSGLALWVPNSVNQDPDSDLLRATEIIPPPAPTPIRYTQVHGSWVHLTTESGHVLSLHCSITQVNSMPQTVDIICQPANFPRLPSAFRLPAPGQPSSDLDLLPRWRCFSLTEFVRLADGHLGAVQEGGRTAKRLVDLLCGPEMPEPSSRNMVHEMTTRTDKAEMQADLFLTHSHYEAYLNLLRLAGCPDGLARPVLKNEKPAKPLSLEHVISIVARWNAPKKTNQLADWCLVLDLLLQKPDDPPTTLPLDVDQWESLSSDQKAWILLNSYESNPLCLFDRDLLDLVLCVCPVYESGTEDGVMVDGPTRWSSVEPWFTTSTSNVDLPNLSSRSQSTGFCVRQIVLPLEQLTELHLLQLNQCAQIASLVGLRVFVQLSVRPPHIPAAVISRADCSQRYRIIAPSASVTMGSILLDCVHWLCPIEYAPLALRPRIIASSDWTVESVPQLAIRLDSSDQLRSLLLYIFKPFADTDGHISGPLTSLSAMMTCEGRGKTRLLFLPTGQLLAIEWWHNTEPVQVNGNVPQSTGSGGSAHIRLISSCVQTLWCVGKSVRRILHTVGLSFASETTVQCERRPTVEDLRSEHQQLKILTAELKTIQTKLTERSASVGNVTGDRDGDIRDNSDQLDELVARLLFLYSCTRNTRASLMFST